MGMEWAWLLPALCAAAFLPIALVGRRLPGQGTLLAVLAIGAGFALFWFITMDFLRDGPKSFEIDWFDAGEISLKLGMTIDQLTIVMLGLVTSVAFAVQVYSLGYLHGDPRIGWYFAAHSLFAASMLGLVLANSLLVFYVAWELVGLCSYLLIGFYYERRSAAEAAKKAFITTRLGDVALLIGILVLFKASGTFQISEILHMATAGELSATTLNVGALLLFIGACGKSAQFPLHVWLPDAMEGPTPVSALIHAATMVAAGVYLVARMAPLFMAAPDILLVVSVIGLTTTFVGALLAMVQNDIKKVLAYSTISQLGLMMLSLGSFGFAAGIFHLVCHGFFKAVLFLGAGSVIHGMHDKQDLREMGGLRHKMPVTFILFLVASAGLVGIFPFSGFFSKDEVLAVVLHERGAIWFGVTLAAVALTGLYVVRMLVMAFLGPPRSHNAEHAHESPPVMLLPMIALAIPATVLGYLALAPGEVNIGSFLVFELQHAEPFHIVPLVAGLATALAVVMLAWGWSMYHGLGFQVSRVQSRFPAVYNFLDNKMYMDHMYQWLVDKVMLGIASVVAWFDKHIVNEGGVDGSGKMTVLGGTLLRYHETGLVANYVLVTALTALVIIVVVALF